MNKTNRNLAIEIDTESSGKSEAQKIYELWLEYPTMVERYAWKFGYGIFAYGKIYQMARDGHTVKSICECQS